MKAERSLLEGDEGTVSLSCWTGLWRRGGMEGRTGKFCSQRCSCCAECHLGWLVPLRSQSCGTPVTHTLK